MQPKRILMIVLFVVFVSPLSGQNPDPFKNPTVEQQVRTAFEDWIAAFQKGDKEKFMSFIWKSPRTRVVPRRGEMVVGWDAFRQIIEGGSSSGSTAKFNIIDVLPLSDSSAALTYTATDRDSAPLEETTRGTIVWSRIDGAWRIMTFHFSRPEKNPQ